MNFALTPQMIDKIGFAMEDQKEQYAADVDTGELGETRGCVLHLGDDGGAGQATELLQRAGATMRDPLSAVRSSDE